MDEAWMSEHFEWTGEARRLADHDQGCAGGSQAI